jgi:hypothetical protein
VFLQEISRKGDRTNGGMNTKIHAICDSKGHALKLFVTARQVSDYIAVGWFREALKNKGYAPASPVRNSVGNP